MVTNSRKNKFFGSALVEFALVLPVFLLITGGIIDFSILFYNKAVITNASREGARYGVVVRYPTYASANAIQTYAQGYCSDYLISFASEAPDAIVTATSSVTPPVKGAILTVTVAYTYTDILLHHFISTSQIYQLSATTKMAYE